MIEINNLTVSSIDEEFLKGVAKKVLKWENKEKVGLSIALIGQARMRKFNKKYRGENKVTDVLSFGEGLNEIVICPAAVETKRELARVLTHGILHLLGYEHGKNMEKRQEYYLSLLKC